MKKTNLKIYGFFFAVITAAAFFLPGCSYMADAIEGAITERASFSIDAEYNSSTNEVTITWDESGSFNDFAGFEIYRTSEANDEFSKYIVIASYYQGSPTVGLSNSSYTYNVGTINGVYFYRVGIIAWDEDDETDREKNYSGGTGWDNEPDREWNYNHHTDIDRISGYAMVRIP